MTKNVAQLIRKSRADDFWRRMLSVYTVDQQKHINKKFSEGTSRAPVIETTLLWLLASKPREWWDAVTGIAVTWDQLHLLLKTKKNWGDHPTTQVSDWSWLEKWTLRENQTGSHDATPFPPWQYTKLNISTAQTERKQLWLQLFAFTGAHFHLWHHIASGNK